MNLTIIINKFILRFKPIQYTSFWWWYRLMNHKGFRFDDHHLWKSFWTSLNGGWYDMTYKWEFENFWGKGAKPERIILSQRDFNALQKRLNEPPDPDIAERFREILNKPAPWD
jgi:hypothetical protein